MRTQLIILETVTCPRSSNTILIILRIVANLRSNHLLWYYIKFRIIGVQIKEQCVAVKVRFKFKTNWQWIKWLLSLYTCSRPLHLSMWYNLTLSILRHMYHPISKGIEG